MQRLSRKTLSVHSPIGKRNPREIALGLQLSSTVMMELYSALTDIHRNPYPHVPNPPGCHKRASVALVLRIRPTFPHHASYNSKQCGMEVSSFQERLENFFAQDWVQRGDPELLFIKRASRKGDRWTGHIAFPGGKREPDDLDDQSTSVRETREEAGLDLDVDHFMLVGNLAERVVTAFWGKTPYVLFKCWYKEVSANIIRLMVLCPFIYLALRHDLPPLTLQPSEVGSVHWVSIRALLSPALRTYERCDIADRTTHPRRQISRVILRAMFGQMLFNAVELIPTENLYCSSISNFIPETQISNLNATHFNSNIKSWWLGNNYRSSVARQPLLLWGLTLGIAADFLGYVSAEDASGLWAWPTLSPWDIRYVIWAWTYSFRARSLSENGSKVIGTTPNNTTSRTAEIGGLDSKSYTIATDLSSTKLRLIAGRLSLDSYFSQLKKAVIVAVFTRFLFGGIVVALLVRKYRLK